MRADNIRWDNSMVITRALSLYDEGFCTNVSVVLHTFAIESENEFGNFAPFWHDAPFCFLYLVRV